MSFACGASPSSMAWPRAAYACVGSHFAMFCSQLREGRRRHPQAAEDRQAEVDDHRDRADRVAAGEVADGDAERGEDQAAGPDRAGEREPLPGVQAYVLHGRGDHEDDHDGRQADHGGARRSSRGHSRGRAARSAAAGGPSPSRAPWRCARCCPSGRRSGRRRRPWRPCRRSAWSDRCPATLAVLSGAARDQQEQHRRVDHREEHELPVAQGAGDLQLDERHGSCSHAAFGLLGRR